jgi:hypothetical protein
MLNRFLTFVLLFIFTGSGVFAQYYRSEGMGGLTYSIKDNHYSLSIYDFGKNPAGLYEDEQTSQLSAMPYYGNTWGGYHRKYDPQGEHLYSVGFTGIKTLGTSGTFYGYTEYSYDERSDVYKNLRYNPYRGEGFFATDSSMGNIKYDGPKVCFMYSLEILPDLYFGASADYKILSGLKRIYSYAEVTYRDVSGVAGLSYKISDNLEVGATFELFDSQESMTCENIDLTEVEIWNYRGDKFAIKQRGSSVSQKEKYSGLGYGLQLYANPIKKLEIGFTGNYSSSDAKSLVAKSGLKEIEDNYASFEDYNCKLQAKYSPAAGLITGIYGAYFYNSSWTKNSQLDLKLWDWNTKEMVLGAGVSYGILPDKLLAGVEYEFSKTKADSSKFIDGIFVSPSSNNHLIRGGLEYQYSEDLIFRCGFNYKTEQIDFIAGGEDVILTAYTFGVCLRYFEDTEINFNVNYGNTYPKNSSDLKRKTFSSFAEVKLFSF